MPKENIERAIKKGTGELEGVSYDEVTYEGYGPGGVAVLVTSLTDNKNRTVAEVRHAFTRSGGNLGESGCVAWMFEKKGFFSFEKDQVNEDTLMEIALEAGAEDIRTEEDSFEIVTAPEEFEAVKKVLDGKGLTYSVSEITMLPQTSLKLDGKQAEQMLRLMESLEDLDDVQKVYSNFDISDETLEKIGAV